MAISKIVKVKSLYATVTYCTRNEKTDYGRLVSTFGCDIPFAVRQFNDVNASRRQLSNRKFTVESWMIFQSFVKGEVSAEKAHEIGVELAKRYLGNEHQYFVTTHIDAGHIHNHIVFNATRFIDMKSFDSRNKHIIQDLRKTNDEICAENNLSVIKEPKGKGVTQREYYARRNNRSYKARLEKLIDNAINNAESYQDFLAIMDRSIEVRFGATLAFKFPEQERFTRLSRLGIDYSENSIKYRIENKAITVTKLPEIKQTIDTSSEKYQGKENAGLRRWATRQNINTLAEMSHTMHTQQITSDEYKERQQSSLSRMTEIGKRITAVDSKIQAHESYIEQEAVYRKSFNIMKGYKSATDKAAYKKRHFKEFRAYDKAKATIAAYKAESGKIPNPETIKREIEELKVERTVLYTEYQIAKEEVVHFTNRQIERKEQDIKRKIDQEHE